MTMEAIGYRAVLQDIGKYLAGAHQLEQANAGMTKSLGGVASISKTAVLGVAALGAAAGAAAIAIGGMSLKAASRFSDTMAQVDALTNATAEDVDRLKAGILDMAKRVPKSPDELGAAAYFILSSGINDVAEALDVLEESAKLSTAGLGETKQVADLLTSVLNAYGKSNITAAQAGDILAATVREGKGEASEFASVIGGIIPLAAVLGTKFDEVGALLAVITNTGDNASEAATKLRGILNQLASPSDKAKDRLEEVGLSFDFIRKNIKEKGLINTLFILRDAFKGNIEALSDIFPEVRGLGGFLSAIESQGDATRQVLDRIRGSTGLVDEAFNRMKKQLSFNVGILKNEFNVALIRLGDLLLPLAIKGIRGLERGFGALGPLLRSAGTRLQPIIAQVKELSRLFVLGFKGGAIGGDFSATEKAVFNLGETARRAADGIKAASKEFGYLVHLFSLGLGGGEIGGEFDSTEQAAFRFGRTLREDVLPPLRDLAAFGADVAIQFGRAQTAVATWAAEAGILGTFLLGLQTILEGFVFVVGLVGQALSPIARFLRENETAAKLLGIALTIGLLPALLTIQGVQVGFVLAIGFMRKNLDFLKRTVNEVKDAVNDLIDAIKKLPDKLPFGLGDVLGKVAGKFGFQAGGIIKKPSIVQVGEGNRPEAILPLANPMRSRQILAGVSPGLVASMMPRQAAASQTFAPNISVRGATLEDMEGVAIRAVRDAFRQQRSAAMRGGGVISPAIG